MSPDRATSDKTIAEAIAVFKEDAKKHLADAPYRNAPTSAVSNLSSTSRTNAHVSSLRTWTIQ